MKRKTLFTCLTLVFLFVSLVIQALPASACGGSPAPPCGRAGWLGKFFNGIVVAPPGAFAIPIGVNPGVVWNAGNPLCAQPIAASISLTLNCFPVAGGPPIVLGPIAFPQPVPVAPGAQPPGGVIVNFPMPAGMPPSVCLVVGTYDVTFGVGIGGGLISFGGDLEICIVEPSPSDPSGLTPRLDLELLTPEPIPGREEGAYTFRAGDQEYVYIRVSNNDTEREAELDINSDANQVGILPGGFLDDTDAYNNDAFRVAEPDDIFPAEFFFEGDPLPWQRIPGIPGIPLPPINGGFTLPPGQIGVFGVAVNSYGPCSTGSCNERNVVVDATLKLAGFPDDLLTVCNQFSFLVDNAEAPRYPGLTIQDDIKVAQNVDAQFGAVFFDTSIGGFIDVTHNGNLLPPDIFPQLQGPPQPVVRMVGQGLPQTGTQFEPSWQDEITLERFPGVARWTSVLLYQDDGFQPRTNETILLGFDQLGSVCGFPSITLENPQDPQNHVRVEADLSTGCDLNTQVNIFELIGFQFQLVQQGTLGQLLADPNLRIDFDTCRTLSLPLGNLLAEPLLVPDPPFLVENFDPVDLSVFQQFILIEDEQGQPAPWNATIAGPPGATLPFAGGVGVLEVEFDPSLVTPGLIDHEWYITVTSPGYINSPLVIPVVGRRLAAPVATPDPPVAPAAFALAQNRPNPFNPTTTIEFAVPTDARVVMKLYDIRGREVRTLLDDDRPAGTHSVVLDASGLASGVYWYRMEAGDFSKSRRLVLVE